MMTVLVLLKDRRDLARYEAQSMNATNLASGFHKTIVIGYAT
jgi:phage terminase large subunit-like protein